MRENPGAEHLERATRDGVEVVILYRPCGPEEMALVRASGMRRWPPRLPAIRDLIDADASHTVERVARALYALCDPLETAADRAPGDAQLRQAMPSNADRVLLSATRAE